MSVKKHENAGSGCSGACCLKVADLSVSLGEQTILEHVSFHLHCGEITALIGPNGAGKSTLFRTILGQLPHAGTIDFQQAGGRGDPVSVLDLFVSAIDTWPVFLPAPKKVRARVAACLERVHAESLIDKRIGSLSGGELQRVLLAMALEPVPHILILDEPLSGVDIEGEKQLLDMLDEVRRSYDLSILLSTHDFATLEEYADKVILLQSGVLKAGTPAEVLSSPEFQEVFHLSLGRGRG